VLDGNLKAIDEIAKLKEKLYEGIDYKKDKERSRSNWQIMRETFDPIGEATGDGNQAAFDALLYALKIRSLRGRTTHALAVAAAKGHKPSLNILINYKDHDMLLSTTVGASYKFKRSMPTEIIALLTKTNLRRSALSHMSARAIQIAAQDGNRKAKLALRELPMQAKNML